MFFPRRVSVWCFIFSSTNHLELIFHLSRDSFFFPIQFWNFSNIIFRKDHTFSTKIHLWNKFKVDIHSREISLFSCIGFQTVVWSTGHRVCWQRRRWGTPEILTRCRQFSSPESGPSCKDGGRTRPPRWSDLISLPPSSMERHLYPS